MVARANCVKAFKNARKMFSRDPYALILHHNADIRTTRLNRDTETSSVRAKCDCVLQQVFNYLPQAKCIPFDAEVWFARSQFYAVLLEPRP